MQNIDLQRITLHCIKACIISIQANTVDEGQLINDRYLERLDKLYQDARSLQNDIVFGE